MVYLVLALPWPGPGHCEHSGSNLAGGSWLALSSVSQMLTLVTHVLKSKLLCLGKVSAYAVFT